MEFSAESIPEGYVEGIWKLKTFGVLETTRNGPVITIPEPVTFTLYDPTKRVLADAIRNANPFFHVMEFVWMMSGGIHVDWLLQFNKRMEQYANIDVRGEYANSDGLGGRIINGAYGYRWLIHWTNQVNYIINLLKGDPSTRQAVLTMWDPTKDLFQREWKDRPCNTHIYFRVVNGHLNMTVCNRSNDFVWGMMGANAVHLTLLHEFVALAARIPLGYYRVFTNNLHFYLNQYANGDAILETMVLDSVHGKSGYPVLDKYEDWLSFFIECRYFVRGHLDLVKNKWLRNVALPMHDTYIHVGQPEHVEHIASADWRECCSRWLARNRSI